MFLVNGMKAKLRQFNRDENNNILTKDELMKIYVIPNEKSEEKRIHLNFGLIYSINNVNPNENLNQNNNLAHNEDNKIKY